MITLKHCSRSLSDTDSCQAREQRQTKEGEGREAVLPFH